MRKRKRRIFAFFLLPLCLLCLLSGCAAVRGALEKGAMTHCAYAVEAMRRAAKLSGLCMLPGSAENLYEEERGTLETDWFGGAVKCEYCVLLAKTAMDPVELAVFSAADEEEAAQAAEICRTRLAKLQKKYRVPDPGAWQLVMEARYGRAGAFYYWIIAQPAAAEKAEKALREYAEHE